MHVIQMHTHKRAQYVSSCSCEYHVDCELQHNYSWVESDSLKAAVKQLFSCIHVHRADPKCNNGFMGCH